MILVDTNIVIYATDPALRAVRKFLEDSTLAISVITRVEALGYHALDAMREADLEQFFLGVTIFPVDDPVITEAIRIRRRQRVKLGDALIAATAIVHGLRLATNNVRDFQAILGLDTFSIPLE